MLTVIITIPATVPIPNNTKYVSAHRGLWIVASTRRATAAEPAIPCTNPTTRDRKYM